MAKSSSVPDTVDLEGIAGDTLSRTILITAPGFIAGRVWSAQVRSTIDASIIDATFDITEPVTDDGTSPAVLTLTAAATRALVDGGVIVRRVGASGRTVTQGVYTGVWDCQLAPAGGGDPTTTIVRGTVMIVGDVTRDE